MSSQVFPSFTGIGYPIPRRPMWNTTTQKVVSGKQTRLANWTYPIYQWDLLFNLREGSVTGSAFTEMSQLKGFYNSRQGSFDSFLFTDPDDNTVTGQAIGTGDGSTTAFQLARANGGFVEPVLAPNAVSAVYDNATPVAAIAAPTNGTLTSTTAGALAATTYYVRSTWVTATGETAAG